MTQDQFEKRGFSSVWVWRVDSSKSRTCYSIEQFQLLLFMQIIYSLIFTLCYVDCIKFVCIKLNIIC